MALVFILLGCAPRETGTESGPSGLMPRTETSGSLEIPALTLDGQVIQPGTGGALAQVGADRILVPDRFTYRVGAEAVQLSSMTPGSQFQVDIPSASARLVAVTPGVATLEAQDGGELFQVPVAALPEELQTRRVEMGGRQTTLRDELASGQSPVALGDITPEPIEKGSAETGMVLERREDDLYLLVTRAEGLELAHLDLTQVDATELGDMAPGSPIAFAWTDEGLVASEWGYVAESEEEIELQLQEGTSGEELAPEGTEEPGLEEEPVTEPGLEESPEVEPGLDEAPEPEEGGMEEDAGSETESGSESGY